MGVDFAKQRDETVVILLEKGDQLILRHISAWSGMNYTEQLGRIKNLLEHFKVKYSAADQTGVGEAVLEELRNITPRVEGVIFSQQSKVELANTLRYAFERRLVTIPNDRKLIMQLNSLSYMINKTGNLLFTNTGAKGLHDDYVWALALAIYAARNPRGYDGPMYTASGP